MHVKIFDPVCNGRVLKKNTSVGIQADGKGKEMLTADHRW